MRLLRAADYVRTPWKNGGGSTREICRDQGEGLDGFGWRLSIADIEQGGPFSTFAGYNRIITVLEGEGMRLQVDGVDSGALRAFEPFAFSGDSAVSCELINGPIQDFNLIYSPVRFTARLQWLNGDAPLQLNEPGTALIVFAAGPHAQVEVQGNTAVLQRHDTLILPPSPSARVTGHCCVIALSAR